MKFLWDEYKNIENQIKHGISFDDVTEILASANIEIIYDHEHSSLEEDRFRAYGKFNSHDSVIIVFTEVAPDIIRIISARKK